MSKKSSGQTDPPEGVRERLTEWETERGNKVQKGELVRVGGLRGKWRFVFWIPQDHIVEVHHDSGQIRLVDPTAHEIILPGQRWKWKTREEADEYEWAREREEYFERLEQQRGWAVQDPPELDELETEGDET